MSKLIHLQTVVKAVTYYRSACIYRMFCKYQTFANFARVDPNDSRGRLLTQRAEVRGLYQPRFSLKLRLGLYQNVLHANFAIKSSKPTSKYTRSLPERNSKFSAGFGSIRKGFFHPQNILIKGRGHCNVFTPSEYLQQRQEMVKEVYTKKDSSMQTQRTVNVQLFILCIQLQLDSIFWDAH